MSFTTFSETHSKDIKTKDNKYELSHKIVLFRRQCFWFTKCENVKDRLARDVSAFSGCIYLIRKTLHYPTETNQSLIIQR